MSKSIGASGADPTTDKDEDEENVAPQPLKGKGKVGAGPAAIPCRFFGSAKGCLAVSCPFSHDTPNKVFLCTFASKPGNRCDKGDACTFRHVRWASAEQARIHYANRACGAVAVSTQRYKELHRDKSSTMPNVNPGEEVALADKLRQAGTDMQRVVERDIQIETYGSKAMRMMEKMGYKSGAGLGKEGQGRKQLLGPALALERASEKATQGAGLAVGTGAATTAERRARLADARAQKHQRVDEVGFVQHNLLSSDESSDDEEAHRKARDMPLQQARKPV